MIRSGFHDECSSTLTEPIVKAALMAYGLIYEFPSTVGKREYDAVNEKLGIDPGDPKSAWPTAC
jgi:hypothetical protein